MNKNIVLSGSLDFLSISDLFQILGANKCTGVLRITSRFSETPGVVYIKDGNPVDAESPSLTGLDAVNALFGWVEGDFEFSKEPVNMPKKITKNRMEITLDALKLMDEGLIEKLGPVSFTGIDSSKSENNFALPVVKGPLVDYMYVADEEDYQDGDTIVQQGKHGNWIWVVLDGILDIRKETPKGQVTILKVGRGAFIGNISVFLEHSSVRNYTVTAAGDVQLGVLDSQRLSMENAILSQDFKKIIKSLDKRLNQCTNRAVDVHLKKKTSSDFLKGKSRIINQGEKKEGFFIVEEGTAHVVRKVDEKHVLLVKLREDDFFGDVPFFNLGHEPHSASIFTSEDFQFKKLPLEDLRREYNKLSTTIKNMMENTANVTSAITSMICELTDKIS